MQPRFLFHSRERSRVQFCACVEDRDSLRKILERKVDLAIRGDKEAQHKLYQAGAEKEAKNWEKRNRDCSIQEINQEFESQRFLLNQASRWADQAQRDKIRLCGEIDSSKRIMQEIAKIEELRRICCEEAVQARQARSEELSVQQRRNPATVSQMMTQIHVLQNKVNSLLDVREFYDPESGSSSRATLVPD